MSSNTHTIEIGVNAYELPRVTTIVKPFDYIPLSWPAKEAVAFIQHNWHEDMDKDALAQLYTQARTAHERKSAEARELGSLVHEAIHQHATGRTPILCDETAPMFEAALEWEEEYRVHTIASELRVHSFRHRGYAGTLDRLCTIRKPGWRLPRVCVVDYKVSPRIYASALPQVSMYRFAVEEMHSLRVPHAAVLRLDKEKPGKWQLKLYGKGEMQRSFYQCLHLIDWWWSKRRKKK